MKKKFILFVLLSLWQVTAHATDLMTIYQQALTSDPIFQQAISQQLSTSEGVPINLAALLPNISGSLTPTLTRTGYAGTYFVPVINGSVNFLTPRNNTQRAYTMSLNITQTVFNYAQFAALAGSVATSKAAEATLNSALQNLMLRVANAYFTVLRDEDNLSFNEANKRAYAEQLDQAKQQFKVGLKTLTDVYTAQASYDAAVASYIAAQTLLANDKENLRVITGNYYSSLATLREDFPLVSPEPTNVEEWVKKASAQNWAIKAAQYNVSAARAAIHQQFSGHLPTVSVQATMDRQYANNMNGYDAFNIRNGPGTQTDRSVGLNINVPFFAGGGVIAETKQATYNYQNAQQQLEQALRDTINSTRQSYLNIISGISQVKADKQTIKSTISSLQGLEASYRVGTETLVNVLDQQQKVFRAQTQYATDRYAFVMNILTLKQAAGTLSFDDLKALNVWLEERKLSAKRSK